MRKQVIKNDRREREREIDVQSVWSEEEGGKLNLRK